ncbi:S-layer homology domain-containing protein [Paenibacillus sp. SC116]|uniref:S-layer homology domain-containing protein n=1 Tax=Paenibacillus sp. SC116 TaxID=2968986 RepID=UPI00215A63E4|nr:S-layer homology domain-containing protein [Paenibacillus sp. SC116]MCR8842694.1 S-layer homology domain-containing protein [Paenibacillus sp. SC116]
MKKIFFRNSIIMLMAMLLAFPLQSSQAHAAEPIPEYMYLPFDIMNHWAFDELDNFVNADLLRGYVDEYGDVYVKPNQSISRAEFVSILVRALGLTSDQAGTSFTDVQQGKWHYEPIRIASSLGIVNGTSESTFGPNQPVKRGEIAALIVRAFSSTVQFTGEMKSFTDVPDYYAAPSIMKASQVGIVHGATATTFKPFANATRAEAVVMLQRALDLQSSDLPEDSTLTKVIADWSANNTKAINDNAFDQLSIMDKQYATGYHLAYSATANNELMEIVKEGATFTAKINSEQKLTVQHKTDRFAVVESTGGIMQITTKLHGSEVDAKQSMDGHYLLKKMPDNSWKIYMYAMTEQQ